MLIPLDPGLIIGFVKPRMSPKFYWRRCLKSDFEDINLYATEIKIFIYFKLWYYLSVYQFQIYTKRKKKT